MRRPTSAEGPSCRLKRHCRAARSNGGARGNSRTACRRPSTRVPTRTHAVDDFVYYTGAAPSNRRAARPTPTAWLWPRPTAARPSRATSSRRPLTGIRGPIEPRSRCRRNSRDPPKRSGREESTASSRGASSEGARTGTTTASSRWTTGAFRRRGNFKAPSTHNGVGLAAAGARPVHCRRRRGGAGVTLA